MRWKVVPVWVGVAVVVLLPQVAFAAFPYFSVHLVPVRPTVGEPVEVTVRLWEDPEHRLPSTEESGGPRFEPVVRDPLLVALPVAEYRGRPVEGTIPIVPLVRVDAATYRGEVTFPQAGDWVIVSFPNMLIEAPAPGWPDIIEVEVVAETGRPSAEPGNRRRALGLVSLALAAILLIRGRRKASRSSQ